MRKKLHLLHSQLTYAKCSAEEFAEVVDVFQKSALNHEYYKGGPLLPGVAVEYIRPQSPRLSFVAIAGTGTPRGARRAGGPAPTAGSPAPAGSSPTSGTGFAALKKALKPFENGKFMAEYHVQFNKTYSCRLCFYLKADGRNPPER